MMSQIDGSRLLVKIPAPATGRVVGLASSPLHRFSKSARESLVLLEGLGAEGDVHAGAFVRHRYLARRRPKMPNLRQVHLIPLALLDLYGEHRTSKIRALRSDSDLPHDAATLAAPC
jgi:hypothetical protein